MNHSKPRTGIPLLFKRLPWLQARKLDRMMNARIHRPVAALEAIRHQNPLALHTRPWPHDDPCVPAR
jgi:hypothetical protein